MNARVWYADGLRFGCIRGCSRCCGGAPGDVFVSAEEREALAAFLGLGREQFEETYVRHYASGRCSLKERRNGDCVLLAVAQASSLPEMAAPRLSGTDASRVPETQGDERTGKLPVLPGCSVYALRPKQCRTYPFWPEVLCTPETWQREAKRCPGLNSGRWYSAEEIGRMM